MLTRSETRRAPNQKYHTHEEILIIDPKLGIVVTQGKNAVIWDEVRAYMRFARRGTQLTKAVVVQVPKHLTHYEKFVVVLIPLA